MKSKIYLAIICALYVGTMYSQISSITLNSSQFQLNPLEQGCDEFPFELSEDATISVKWDFGDCSQNLKIEFHDFEFIPSQLHPPEPGITFSTQFSTFCWEEVGDAPITGNNPSCGGPPEGLDFLTGNEHCFLPTSGSSVNTTLNFMLMTLDEFGIPDQVCFFELVIDPFDFICYCELVDEVKINAELVGCGHDACTGILDCNWELSLEYFLNGNPTALYPDQPLIVRWYIDDIPFGPGNNKETLQLNNVYGGEVRAVITYASVCVFETEPVVIYCDGLSNFGCTGVHGDRVKIESSISGCTVDASNSEGVECTYALNVVPVDLAGIDIAITDVEWYIGGVLVGTGNPLNISVNQASTQADAVVYGTVDGVACSWELSNTLVCNGDVCGNPCDFASDTEIEIDYLGNCGGCSYKFSLSDPTHPNIYDYVTNVRWTTVTFPQLQSPISETIFGNTATFCFPNLSFTKVTARIEFITGCVIFLEEMVFCDDYINGCSPGMQVNCVGQTPENHFCTYDFFAFGCPDVLHAAAIGEGHQLTYNLYICNNNGSTCLVDATGVIYEEPSGTFYVNWGHTWTIEYEVFYNGVSIYYFYDVAGCPSPCTENKPAEINTNRYAFEKNLNELNEKPYIHIFPNPTDDILEIKITDNLSPSTKLQIFDLQGRLYLESELETNPRDYKFDMLSFPNGTYLLKVNSEEEVYHVQKITVIH